MLKREHIKQAIEAISERAPEIGYALDETLGMGRITVPQNPAEAVDGDNFFFWFEDQRATVKKFIYFNAGTVGIEERLLVKYGELTEKQLLQSHDGKLDFRAAATGIRRGGLKFMVTHELDFAIQRVQGLMGKLAPEKKDSVKDGAGAMAFYQKRLAILHRIRHADPDGKICPDNEKITALFTGSVNAKTPARFMVFPFSLGALMQVADINLEFFHVRFLLDCLINGLDKTLFICLVDEKIVGLIHVTFRHRLFYQGLEIKYVATLQGGGGGGSKTDIPPVRGAGAFLVAGVWLLWQSGVFRAKELILDSETEARTFYEAIGFQSRGSSEYVLKTPRGYLVKAIAAMACSSPVSSKAGFALAEMMKGQIRFLCRKTKDRKQAARRRAVIDAMGQILGCGDFQEIIGPVVAALKKHRKKIPEAAELMRLADYQGDNH